MTPLLFGDSGSPLFGVFYEPKPASARDHAVLVCPPVGHEYMRTHVAITGLAKRLAAAGFAAFKFDYFGTGDSAGATERGDCDRWRESIALAADELSDLAAPGALSIVGLRFGASLAATVDFDRGSVQAFVAWDPVVNGVTYLSELQAMHDQILSGTRRFREPRHRRQDDDELLGFRFPPSMRASIGEIDLLESVRLVAPRCLVVSSYEAPEFAGLGNKLEASGAGECAVERVADAGEWTRLHDIHDAMLASLIPERIVDFLGANGS